MSLAFSYSLTNSKYCSEVLLELTVLSIKFALLLSLSELKTSENSEQREGRKTPLISLPSTSVAISLFGSQSC